MKKVLGILIILSCIFLVSCKKDEITEINKEKETMPENLSTRKNLNDNEDMVKNNILNILYSQDVEGIKWYFRLEANFEEIEYKKFEISDEYEEKFSNVFFKKYFSDDLEMQEKLKQLPLSYRYYIYQTLKKYSEQNINPETILRILYSQDVEGIKWYFRFEANFKEIEYKKLEISDEYKEKFSNDFLKKYFSEDLEMQEKLKQLPLSYRYYIYQKLK